MADLDIKTLRRLARHYDARADKVTPGDPAVAAGLRLAASLLEKLQDLRQTTDRWGSICVSYADLMAAIAAAQEEARGEVAKRTPRD